MFGTAFCIKYFGENYADKPVNRSLLFVGYGYFASLTIIGGMAKFADITNGFTQWMTKRNFGLYVFHYMGISTVALFIAKPRYLSAPLIYCLSAVSAFAVGYLLYEIISRIPFYKWMVLGITDNKDRSNETKNK